MFVAHCFIILYDWFVLPSVLWHCWLVGRKGIRSVKKWGDGGGGHWLVRMEWRPAGWSVCLPLLIFPCTIKVQKFSSATGLPGWFRKKGHKTVVVWCGGLYCFKLVVCLQFLGSFSTVKALGFIYCKVLVSWSVFFLLVSLLFTVSKRLTVLYSYMSLLRLLVSVPVGIEHVDGKPKCLWVRCMADAMLYLRLSSQLQSTASASWLILISHLTEHRKPIWPEWLVTYQDSTDEWSPISVLTGFDVE